ncbi:hypothetical protein [Dapis sp. BLCC M172]|uniref:hypothetical protein n=1 Tax=Dapis sp. BLCC M172 TaxID=2975281 RepID=UPI003CF27D82
MQLLKKELWGDKLLADAAKLLENTQIKALLSQTDNSVVGLVETTDKSLTILDI